MSSSVRRVCAGGITALALATWACQADELFLEEPVGSVITLVDGGSSLASARTFALPDTIIQMSDLIASIDHTTDRKITASIRGHLLALGWRDATRDASPKPDVLVLVAASMRIQTGVVYDDWFGAWGYLPYWSAPVDESWVWGTPDGAIPYAFPAGTLLVTMLDLRAQNAVTQRIALLWAAAIDGVVTNKANTTERALLGIDQAFAQSPYLKVP